MGLNLSHKESGMKISLPSLAQTLAAGKVPSPVTAAKVQVLFEHKDEVVSYANLFTNATAAAFTQALSTHEAEQAKAATAKANPKG
jgi:hypothetical protein